MRTFVTTLFALLIAAWLWFDARAQTNAPLIKGAHRFEKIVDGIYYATASGTISSTHRARGASPFCAGRGIGGPPAR